MELNSPEKSLCLLLLRDQLYLSTMGAGDNLVDLTRDTWRVGLVIRLINEECECDLLGLGYCDDAELIDEGLLSSEASMTYIGELSVHHCKHAFSR